MPWDLILFPRLINNTIVFKLALFNIIKIRNYAVEKIQEHGAGWNLFPQHSCLNKLKFPLGGVQICYPNGVISVCEPP